MDIQNKTVTILGAQRTGVGLAQMVRRLGGIPQISEQAPAERVPAAFREALAGIGVVGASAEFGGHTRGFLERCDLVVLSPGVSVAAEPVAWARKKGIPVLGEVEFAFQFCPKPVVAVTGSNGKTTVVTLIHLLLERAGYRSCLCGNIGTAFSGCVLDLNEKDFVVLETSSFQLETVLAPEERAAFSQKKPWLDLKGFKPRVAVILNINQNHLDRHKDLGEYARAKKRIFLNQDEKDAAVLNAADEYLKDVPGSVRSRVLYFGPGAPDAKGENPNFLAVRAVAAALGIEREVCNAVFKDFKGVEHRLEWVRNVDGVDFINDSKATTAQAAVWALERLGAPVWMICGGRDKNIDFSVLRPLVRAKVSGMFLIGEAKAKLKATFEGDVPVAECADLQDAIAKAKATAVPGGKILLCPMCTSFDMFENFEERGHVFKQIVQSLKVASARP